MEVLAELVVVALKHGNFARVSSCSPDGVGLSEIRGLFALGLTQFS